MKKQRPKNNQDHKIGNQDHKIGNRPTKSQAYNKTIIFN